MDDDTCGQIVEDNDGYEYKCQRKKHGLGPHIDTFKFISDDKRGPLYALLMFSFDPDELPWEPKNA